MKRDTLSEIVEKIEGVRVCLVGSACRAFEALIFENRYTLHPRRIREIGAEEVENFISYLLKEKDDRAAEELGIRRAQEGMGVATLLAFGTLLRRFFFERPDLFPAPHLRAAIESVDSYMSVYLSGYTKAQEAQVLKDQEQMRKALSDALEQQRRELFIKNHAIHTSINGIMLTDLEGSITYLNPSFLKMWGYERPEELLGSRGIDLLGKEQAREIFSQLSGAEGWHGEITVRRRDGSTTAAEVSASLIRDNTGSPVGIMASFVDVSERKRLESQFRQAQKMDALGQLASGIVHDVNNLLTAISGYAQLELMELSPADRVYRSLAQIKTATDRGKSLTQQLRVFTRQASGERRSISLNVPVEETYELIRRTFPPNITIVLNLDPNLKNINADPSQMSQLLMNLCVNARDAMTGDGQSGASGGAGGLPASGGRLTVVTSNVHLDRRAAARYLTAQPGDYVCVKVSDTGVGMPPEVLERLFEPFFTTKGERSGTGLGLAVVYGIVQSHRGFIDVKSAPGIGSIFEVYLPAADCRIEAGPAEEAATTLVAGEGTILVVEDEPQVREMVIHTLRRCGYQVLSAENGLEAVAVYENRRQPIDLVVLDIVMPKMNGWDCFHRLKSFDPRVKVLIMTGYTANVSAEQLLNEGAVGFVEKPINLQPFTQAVYDAIHRGSLAEPQR